MKLSGLISRRLAQVDTGTLAVSRFQRKVSVFELGLALGLFDEHWELNQYEVDVLTESEARLDNFWSAAKVVVPQKRWGVCAFATFEALDAGQLNDDSTWVDLGGSHYGLLFSDAYGAADDGNRGEADPC